MGLKSNIERLRRVDDLDRDKFLAAQKRHEARRTILNYERTHGPIFAKADRLGDSHPTFVELANQDRVRIEVEFATAQDRLGEDNPELWRADQKRIERYLLRTTGNLDDAQHTHAWGADPDTMWAHQHQIWAERGRQEDAKIHGIIAGRAAIEREKRSPVRFDNHPRYGTPVYEDGSIGDPKLYPRQWTWPLPDFLHTLLGAIDEVNKVIEFPTSDEGRAEEIAKYLDEDLGIDFASLCPAPNEQFPKFERIGYI